MLTSSQNWYQNRRAKAKHLKKQEILQVMHFHQTPTNMWEYGDLLSPSYPTSGFHSSELGSTPTQPSADQSMFAVLGPHVDENIPFDLHQQSNYPSWLEMQAAMGAPNMTHHYPSEVSTEHMTETDDALNHFFNGIDVHGNNLPPSAFSEWGSSKGNSVAWTPANQRENPFDESHLLLQQSTSHSFLQDQSIQQPTNEADQYTMCPNNIVTPQSQFVAQQIHPSPPLQQKCEQSPEAPSCNIVHSRQINAEKQMNKEPQVKAESHSRRGSDSSDLANNFDTFHLQKVQSQQNSDEEICKTPPLLNQNLAARRKQRRPAALGPFAMRSYSCTVPQESSPTNKSRSLISSKSVRRIKSTGNSLNVRSGRIQKSGVASAQRSPLSFSTFHEAGAFGHVDVRAAQSTNHSQATLVSNTGSLTPHTPSTNDDQSLAWTKSVHFESSPNVLHSQTFPVSTFDGLSQVTSPPKTPFTEMQAYAEAPMYIHQFSAQYSAPPQSAPPQLTSFPNTSPPNHPTPTTPSTLFVPQATLPESYTYYPMPQMYPQPLSMFHYGQGQPNLSAFHLPQVYNGSSPIGGHNVWTVSPAPVQQKEMEFIIQDFPQPPPPPKEPHQTKQYTFQNSGPSDF